MKHGGYKHHRATYQCWQDMKQRCLNPRHAQYPNYGGRGISICDRWLADFSAFFEDMGEKPKGMTLDRVNNNGNYEPGNCRWATPAEQRRNQRTCRFLEFDGKRMTVEEWAREIGRHPETVRARLRRGHPIHEVLWPGLIHEHRSHRAAMQRTTAAGSPLREGGE